MGERENQQCHQKYDIPTKISKSLRTQQGECTILKHAVVKRPGQICISKKPVTQCSAGCKPSHSDLLEKRIPFVCLREDRMANITPRRPNVVNKCPSWRATLLLSKQGFPNPGLAFSLPTNFKLNGTLITYLNSFNWLKNSLKIKG